MIRKKHLKNLASSCYNQFSIKSARNPLLAEQPKDKLTVKSASMVKDDRDSHAGTEVTKSTSMDFMRSRKRLKSRINNVDIEKAKEQAWSDYK